MNLYTIDTGFFKLDGGAMFGVVPKVIWDRINPADGNNLCSWAMRLLLVENGDRLILVDTGIGNKQDERFLGYYYLHGDATIDSSLAKHGYHRDDVTEVFLTHLHFDHVGGAIARDGDKLAPAFKNATYHSNQKHWEWALNPIDREKASFLKENILPIQESGRLKFIDPVDGITFSEGFDIRFVSGHTEAMMLPLVSYKGTKILYTADLVPSVGHVPIPYVMAYDMFPLTTLQEKKSILGEAAANDWALFFEHDPENECCTLQPTERGVRVKDIFRLDEL